MDDGDTAMPDTQQQAAEPGLLPTLYNGDLDSFQFDQMFTGYSDEAMDKFFTDIFCLPSFPQSESIDPRLLFPDDARPPWSSLQEYRSDADVYVNCTPRGYFEG